MMSGESVILLVLYFYYSLVASQWSYERQDLWPANYCRGKLQSPIPIMQNSVIGKHFEDFKFSESYFEPQDASITNTGHSVEVRLTSNTSSLTISGGGLTTEYVLDSFHFHWKAEHTINNYRYPLESHFVHYATKYGTLENALNHKDGIAVLGAFYNVILKSNPSFDDIVKKMYLIAHNVNRPVKLNNPIIVNDFLPRSTKKFYRYDGSLTTPNCNEVVTWTLFATPSYLSHLQLKRLSSIWTESGTLLTRNYRKLQDLNGRDVYFNSDLADLRKLV